MLCDQLLPSLFWPSQAVSARPPTPPPAMRPDVERFIVCLQHADRFIQTRIKNGRDVGELMEAQVVSLCNQMKGMHLEMDAAAEVTEAIEKGSWPEKMKHRLLDAAVVTAMEPMASPLLKGVRRDTQRCYWFERYLDEESWHIITSQKPLSFQVAQMCKRCEAIGLVLPDEATYGRIVSVILAVGIGYAMDHAQAFSFLNDVKETVRKYMKGKEIFARRHLEYPADPAALPGFLESVKGTEPTDEWKKFPVIITVSNDLALRGTNRKVQLQKRHSGTTFDKPQLEMQKGTLPNFTISKPNVQPRRSKDPVLAIADSSEYGAPLEPTQWSSPWSKHDSVSFFLRPPPRVHIGIEKKPHGFQAPYIHDSKV